MARRWQILAVISLGLLIANLDLFIVDIAFPGIQRDFMAGALLFASGCLLWAFRLTATPSYLLNFLPSMLIGGIGVGLVLAPLAGAAASSLPADRFATGIGVLTMARQVGAVLGVAVLVVVLGPTWPADAVAAFRHAWFAMAAASLAAAASALCLGAVDVPGLEVSAPAGLDAGVAIKEAVPG